MYSLELDNQEWLDLKDLASLSTHHKMRRATFDKPVKLMELEKSSE